MTSSVLHPFYASTKRTLFLTIYDLDVEAPELRRASLAFTFLYLASKSLAGLILGLLTMEYLVNISKRRAFWSLNKDILKITILTTNTPYPSWNIRRIRACTHQRPQRKQVQYAEIMEEGNSFKPVARTTTNKDGTSTTTIPGPVTDEQKILKKND
ncbi:hypothetical protein Tco_1079181 [Tanacetum coccineum]|uniref:Uncharacterized protein n=1 Tax=Tanacetum coccineum TaxID=301880 RepID=A0ABQ5HR27_9ASTR